MNSLLVELERCLSSSFWSFSRPALLALAPALSLVRTMTMAPALAWERARELAQELIMMLWTQLAPVHEELGLV
jgi:hypothetical protein